MGKCLKGVNGIDTITRVDTEEYNVHLAGELKDFNIEDHISKKMRVAWIVLQYAVVAARQAVDANLTINDDNANRIGVWIGSGIGEWKHLKLHIQY